MLTIRNSTKGNKGNPPESPILSKGETGWPSACPLKGHRSGSGRYKPNNLVAQILRLKDSFSFPQVKMVKSQGFCSMGTGSTVTKHESISLERSFWCVQTHQCAHVLVLLQTRAFLTHHGREHPPPMSKGKPCNPLP